MTAQIFPFREGERIAHKRWEVDLAAAHSVNRLGSKRTDRLALEVAEMAEHFPRWLLTTAARGRRLPCKKCGGIIVFDNGIRCVACGATRRRGKKGSTELGWFGLLPPIGIDGLGRIGDRIAARPPSGHIVGRREGLGRYILGPVEAVYTERFPERPPTVRYLPGFFEIPGVERGIAHEYHMLDDGVMCLFAGGEWRQEMTFREVLQQRAYPHVIKFLNYGNGKRDAFRVVT